MRKSILKYILTLTAIIPCLNACDTTKYVEGQTVTAECVYNAFNEPVDFTKSFTLNTEDYKGLEIKSNGNYFYIENFKIYDSFYLADINGDGHRDLCTDYLYTDYNKNQRHKLSFYDLKHKQYLQSPCESETFSYYLSEKDGLLTIKEKTKLYSEDEEGFFIKRTATLLTAKEKATIVWKDLDFKPSDFFCTSMFKTGNSGSSSFTADDDTSPTGFRHMAETGRTFMLYIQGEFGGVYDDAQKYISFTENPGYSIVFGEDWINEKHAERSVFICYYNIIFTEEGNYDINVKVGDVEHGIYFTVDNARFNGHINH